MLSGLLGMAKTSDNHLKNLITVASLEKESKTSSYTRFYDVGLETPREHRTTLLLEMSSWRLLHHSAF